MQRAASVHSGKKATKRKKEKWGTILAMTKNMRLLSVNLRDSVISRAVGASGPRGTAPPPFLADKLISSRRADYAHHIATCPTRFLDLPTALLCNKSFEDETRIPNI